MIVPWPQLELNHSIESMNELAASPICLRSRDTHLNNGILYRSLPYFVVVSLKCRLLNITTNTVADPTHLEVYGDQAALSNRAKYLRQRRDEVVLEDIHSGDEVVVGCRSKKVRSRKK